MAEHDPPARPAPEPGQAAEPDRDLDEIADRLYRLPPGRFIAERTAAAGTAKAAGDRRLATAIGKLRRPTVAGWLVNLLALERPELVEQLTELAGSLRQAQRELAGEQLRELAGQRRATVSALVAQTRSLARAADPDGAAGKLPLAEVEATLHAALADPQVAAQVRSGRLLRAISASGLGELPTPQLRLIRGGREDRAGRAAEGGRPGEPTDRTAEPDQEQAAAAGAELVAVRRQELAGELTAARAAAADAAADFDRRSDQQQAIKRELTEIETEIAALAERRQEIQRALAQAEADTLAARRGAVAARRRVGEAEAALAALDREQG